VTGATGATGPSTPQIPEAIGFNVCCTTWTNQPSALTEFNANTFRRLKFELTNATQARLVVDMAIAGAAVPAKLRAQYSTDQTTWNYLDGSAGPSVDINATGVRTSSWVTLAAGAKADVFLRLVGLSGDGVADPQFSLVQLQAK
jgi:hypothetical protein